MAWNKPGWLAAQASPAAAAGVSPTDLDSLVSGLIESEEEKKRKQMGLFGPSTLDFLMSTPESQTGLAPKDLAARLATQDFVPPPVVPFQPSQKLIGGKTWSDEGTLTTDPDSTEPVYLTDLPWNQLTPAQQAWLIAYDEFDQEHQAGYGIGIARAWNTDAGTVSAKAAIDARYKELAKEHDIPVDETLLGAEAQPNVFHPKASAGGALGRVVGSDTFDSIIRAIVLSGLSAAGGQVIGGALGVGAAGTTTAETAAAAAAAAEAEAIAAGATISEAAAAGADAWAAAAAAATPGVAPGLLSQIGQGALRGGIGGGVASLATGQGLSGVVPGLFTGGLTTGGGYVGTEYANPFIQDVIRSLSETGMGVDDLDPELLNLLEAADGKPALPGLASPEAIASFKASVPQAVPGMTLPIGGADIDITAPGAADIATATGNALLAAPAAVAEPVQAPVTGAPSPTADAAKPTDYVKDAKRVQDLYKLVTGSTRSEVPAFELPAREAGESDEEYFARIGEGAVDYLSLDADAMRAAGLVPGTPEYMNYILEQADAIIKGVFGADPSALLEGESVEDLQAALRDLTENEATQLIQAMYVRGALGRQSFQGSAVDPFTGLEEELGMLSGEAVDPNVAATQRGYARSLENLAKLSGPGARDLLSGLFGRDVDLFGLQGAADTRAEQARLAEQEIEEDLDDEDLVDRYGNIRKRRRKTRG